MRIALCHNLPSGGAKRHIFEQVRQLALRGRQIVEFVPSTADVRFCSLAPYVTNQRVFRLDPVSPLKRRIPFITPYVHAAQGIVTLRRVERCNRAIAEEIDRGNFDCVLVKDCQVAMNPYVLRYLKTPAVFQCHHGLRHRIGNPRSNGTGRASLVEQIKLYYYAPARGVYHHKFFADEMRNARSASAVLTNSEFSRQLLSEYYGIDAHVVYPGVNTEIFRPQPFPKMDYVLSVGALIPSKGYRFLISALARIELARRPRLFIAANSNEPAEEQAVRELAARLRVELEIEKVQDDNRLVEVYNRARVFVYAPRQEALGLAALEAMACGTPVVGVDEGGVRETVLSGITGYLVRRDPQAFAEALDLVLGDEHLRMRMGQAGVECMRSNWTWSVSVDKLEYELGIGAAHRT